MHMPNECGAITCACRLIEDGAVLDIIVVYEVRGRRRGTSRRVTWSLTHFMCKNGNITNEVYTAPDICGIALSLVINPAIRIFSSYHDTKDHDFTKAFREHRGIPSLPIHEWYGNYRIVEIFTVWV